MNIYDIWNIVNSLYTARIKCKVACRSLAVMITIILLISNILHLPRGFIFLTKKQGPALSFHLPPKPLAQCLSVGTKGLSLTRQTGIGANDFCNTLWERGFCFVFFFASDCKRQGGTPFPQAPETPPHDLKCISV